MTTPLRDADDFIVHCPMCLQLVLECCCSLNQWIVHEGLDARYWWSEHDED